MSLWDQRNELYFYPGMATLVACLRDITLYLSSTLFFALRGQGQSCVLGSNAFKSLESFW